MNMVMMEVRSSSGFHFIFNKTRNGKTTLRPHHHLHLFEKPNCNINQNEFRKNTKENVYLGSEHFTTIN